MHTLAALRRRPRLAALVSLMLLGYATSGCLSNSYRIPKQELARIAALPPPARGERVRIVQELGEDRVPAEAAHAGLPPAWQEERYGADEVAVHFAADIAVHVGGPPRPSAAVRPFPAGGGGGGGQVTRAPPAAAADDAVLVAVLAVAVAVLAVGGLFMTEGLRYDGHAAISPWQPIHLEDAQGGERVLALGALTPEDAAAAKAAVVLEDEAWGFSRLGRAPLFRRGFAFKVHLGAADATFDRWRLMGFASDIQLGYFPHHSFGLLASASLTGGEDRFGINFARHSLGLEAQLFPLRLGRLHAGLFAYGGRTVVSARADQSSDGPMFGGGALIEMDLTTRLALSLRGGHTRSLLDGAWSPTWSIGAGLAIY